MNVRRSVLFAAAILGLVGCPNRDDDEPANTAPPPQTAPTPPPTPTAPATPADLRPEGPTAAPSGSGKIEARVKSELDNRADGITGTPIAVAGAKASVQAPTGWEQTKGDVTVAAAADKKAQVAATGFAAEGPSGKLPAVISALGLSACEWGATETVTLGKTKLPATAADGVCTRGTAQVRMAWVSPAAENLLVVGAWETGGDSANVFGAMRSIAKAGGTGDASGIGACCSALRQNANSAPPEQKGAYLSAAAVCDGLKNNPNGRALLGQVRAVLLGANVPATCK